MRPQPQKDHGVSDQDEGHHRQSLERVVDAAERRAHGQAGRHQRANGHQQSDRRQDPDHPRGDEGARHVVSPVRKHPQDPHRVAKGSAQESQSSGVAVVSHKIGVLAGQIAGLVGTGPGDDEDPGPGGDTDDQGGDDPPPVPLAGERRGQ